MSAEIGTVQLLVPRSPDLPRASVRGQHTTSLGFLLGSPDARLRYFFFEFVRPSFGNKMRRRQKIAPHSRMALLQSSYVGYADHPEYSRQNSRLK